MQAPREIRVGVRELRDNLARYLGEAKCGASILVTSRNAVVAEIRAPRPETRRARRPGSLKGGIWMAEDFDAWPRDILDSFDT